MAEKMNLCGRCAAAKQRDHILHRIAGGKDNKVFCDSCKHMRYGATYELTEKKADAAMKNAAKVLAVGWFVVSVAALLASFIGGGADATAVEPVQLERPAVVQPEPEPVMPTEAMPEDEPLVVMVPLDVLTGCRNPEPEPPEEPEEPASGPSVADLLKEDHAIAGQVYEYLHERGWQDVAIAGVLGNLMAECGGQSLDLVPDIYSVDVDGHLHYGLCGWSLVYGPEVGGRDVDGQLDYMTGNIAAMMRQLGGSLEEYMGLQDAQEAGKYFCRYYERGCGISQRMKNAAVALAWIVEKTEAASGCGEPEAADAGDVSRKTQLLYITPGAAVNGEGDHVGSREL